MTDAEVLISRLLKQIAMNEQSARAMTHAIGNIQSRWSPAHLLRRCAADRKILARHTKTACRGLHGDTPHRPECFDCRRDGDEWPCADLRDLADGYGVTP